MTDDTHPALTAAVSSLSADTKALLRKVGFEDHRAIIWAAFSDDEGVTRIVYRSYREDASRTFSLLAAADLLEGLEGARRNGMTKTLWGLADGGVD